MFSPDHFFSPQVKKTSEILTALEVEHRELKNLSDDDSDDDAPSTSKKSKGKAKPKPKIKGKGDAVARIAPVDDDDESAEAVDADATPFERFVRKQQAAVAKCREVRERYPLFLFPLILMFLCTRRTPSSSSSGS